MVSGAVPAKRAAAFTMGELAALTVIGRQVQRHGACALPIDAIAALAGVCRTGVKSAMRQTRSVGLILVKERRIPGRKSLTNVVSIVSREWLAWLRIGIGVGNQTSTVNQAFNPAPLRPSPAVQEGHSRGAGATLVPLGSVATKSHRKARFKSEPCS